MPSCDLIPSGLVSHHESLTSHELLVGECWVISISRAYSSLYVFKSSITIYVLSSMMIVAATQSIMVAAIRIKTTRMAISSYADKCKKNDSCDLDKSIHEHILMAKVASLSFLD